VIDAAEIQALRLLQAMVTRPLAGEFTAFRFRSTNQYVRSCSRTDSGHCVSEWYSKQWRILPGSSFNPAEPNFMGERIESNSFIDPDADVAAKFSLCPVQSEALYFLTHWQADTPILHLSASDSLGRTTVLKEFQRQSGALWIDVRPFVASVAAGHPMAMEDAAWRVLTAAIEEYSHIIVDDFQLLFEFATGCSGYPRSSYYSTVMRAIRLAASSRKCRIVIGSSGNLPEAFSEVAWSTSISEFGVADYRQLFRQILSRSLDEIDFDAIYRFAPNLNCHRIIHLCHWMKKQGFDNDGPAARLHSDSGNGQQCADWTGAGRSAWGSLRSR
jgi:hypothetical protein